MTATHALGWALVHSLWQCALAAVALALLLAIVPARSARIRYALATATLVLTLTLPLTTAVRVGEASPATPGNGLATSAVASRPASDATPAAQAASPEGAMVAQETPRGYAPTTPAIAALRLAPRGNGHAAGAGRLRGGAGTPRGAPARQPAGARPRVGGAAGAGGPRLGAPGDPGPRERAHGAHAVAARRAARPRAGPRAAIRLPREPHPVGDRNPVVLPPGGVVDLVARASGARALLRRLGGGRVRRRALLCGGTARHGAPPRRGPDARAHGGGRLPDGPGAATRGARAHGDLSTLGRRRDRCDARGGDRRRLPPG